MKFLLLLFLIPFGAIAALKNPKDIEESDLIQLEKSFHSSMKHLLQAAKEIDQLEKPMVSIFGGGFIKKTDPMYKKAYQLSQNLARKGFGIITGGNSGIMEAANCGACSLPDHGITSIAIGITDVGEPNTCVQKRYVLDFFFLRKWLLMQYSSAFVIFPGGIGTLDELSEILTLMMTKKMPPVPIYIVGRSYWHPLQRWMRLGVQKGLITSQAYNLLIFTDDIEEIEKGIIQSVEKAS